MSAVFAAVFARLTLLVAVVSVLALGFVAVPAHALQLGPMEVLTDFGQPLEARINLEGNRLRPRDLNLQFYHSRNATRPISLQSVLQLAQLRYSIERDGGDIYIRLFTREPLQEARIGFNLTVRSRRGIESSRRYLNVLPGTLIAGSDGAFRDRRRSRRILKQRQNAGWQLGIASPGPGLVVSSNDYNALWHVAQQVKSGYGLSAFQAMLAIYDINRHAFGEDGTGTKNINYMWAGEELRMPTLEEMNSYDLPSAIVEVAKQNYYADQGPIDSRALSQVLVLESPSGLPGRDPVTLEPWEPEDESDSADLGAEEAEAGIDGPAIPVASEDDAGEGLGLLVYLLLGGGVLLVLALVLLARRGRSAQRPDSGA